MKEAEKINISKYFYITHFGFLQTFSTSILIPDSHSAFFTPLVKTDLAPLRNG